MRWGVLVLGGLLGPVHAADVLDVVVVRMRDYRFHPERVAVKPGTTVRWINDEKRASHSVLFPAEKLASERLLSGESWERRFERSGLYSYICEPHPEMKGTVEVLP